MFLFVLAAKWVLIEQDAIFIFLTLTTELKLNNVLSKVVQKGLNLRPLTPLLEFQQLGYAWTDSLQVE